MLSFFEYLRERVFRAVLAGFQDALDIADGKSNSEIDQAAEKFRQTFGTNSAALPPRKDSGSKNISSASPTESQSAKEPRKGPGRPRKDETPS